MAKIKSIANIEKVIDSINNIIKDAPDNLDTFKEVSDVIKQGLLSSNDKEKLEKYPEVSDTTSGCHNSYFRGKFLGDFSENQQDFIDLCDRIKSGNYSDLFVGDYFTNSFINNNNEVETVNWIIADFNWYLNIGDTPLKNNHIIVISENCIDIPRNMNSTQTTVNGYAGSEMCTFLNGTYSNYKITDTTNSLYEKLNISTCMNGRILKHRTLLSSSMEPTARTLGVYWLTGATKDWAWCDEYVMLLNSMMVWNCLTWDSSACEIGTRGNQLTLFKMNPQSKMTKDGNNGNYIGYWLSGVVSKNQFVICDESGEPNHKYSDLKYGIRPVLLIG